MEITPPMELELYASLEYEEAPGLEPFGYPFAPAEDAANGGNEFLFCFEIDSEQSERIDPKAESFPGKLVFAGKSAAGQQSNQGDICRDIRLPAGRYFFTQQRRVLDREGCIHAAIEMQKDGLWERLQLGNRLYIRYLFEDGKHVTQFFRPVRGSLQTGSG